MKYDVILFTGMSGRFWHAKPLGAYRVATELRNHGYSVKVVDFISQWLNEPTEFLKLLNLVIGPNTLFVGFSGTFFSNRNIKSKISNYNDFFGQWSPWPVEAEKMNVYLKYIKKTFPHVKTVYGGISEPYNIARVAKFVDFVVSGLADNTAIELADHLSKKTSLKYMIGPDSSKIIAHDITAKSFDFPKSKVEYRVEDHIMPGEILPLETSRGCLFKCSFCDYPLIGRRKGDPEYHKNTDTFAEELKNNYNNYQIDTYMMVDDTFNETTGKLEELLRARDKSGIDIKFSAYIRADLLIRFPEQVKLLNDLGMVSAFFGIESLYRPSAMAIGKSTHPDKIKDLFYKLKQDWIGDELRILGSFIIGLPEDNPETLSTWLPWLENNDCPIDMLNINAMALSSLSDIGKYPEKYGYTIDKETGMWSNKYWNLGDVKKYTNELRNRYWNSGRLRIAGWDFMGLKNIGLDHHNLHNKALNELDYTLLVNKQQTQWQKYRDIVLQYESK
jgi:radical SAM superfamily enzyme YgiQ (UPF0313 family)